MRLAQSMGPVALCQFEMRGVLGMKVRCAGVRRPCRVVPEHVELGVRARRHSRRGKYVVWHNTECLACSIETLACRCAHTLVPIMQEPHSTEQNASSHRRAVRSEDAVGRGRRWCRADALQDLKSQHALRCDRAAREMQQFL